MKRTGIITIILAVLFCFSALAQETKETPITGNQRVTLVQSITKVHQQMKALSANFTQEKSSELFTEKVVQKGRSEERRVGKECSISTTAKQA